MLWAGGGTVMWIRREAPCVFAHSSIATFRIFAFSQMRNCATAPPREVSHE